MWAIKEKVAHIVVKTYPLYLAVRMRRYGSLIKIKTSGSNEAFFLFFFCPIPTAFVVGRTLYFYSTAAKNIRIVSE